MSPAAAPRNIVPRAACLALALAFASCAFGARDAGAAALSPAAAAKLDPRLVRAATLAGDEPVSVWLAFADKGEQGPGDLVRRLAEAEAGLTPRARARRLRAGVRPLVDERDLPVHAPYLEALGARGLPVHGVSRWFNRAAVRMPAARLGEAAALDFVARIVPVERMRRSLDPTTVPAPPEASARAGAQGAIDYGLSAAMLEQIGLPALHDQGFIGAGVLICVLDEGFTWTHKHEALRDRAFVATRDFLRGVESVEDTTTGGMRHGTWVLGAMAGNRPGAYVGAAFGADYALGRTETTASETPQEMVTWAMGAEWADSLGADIVSSSLGYFTFDDPEDSYTYADMDGKTTLVSRAAQVAASKGILVVNSVGNEGNSGWHWLIAPSDVHGDSVVAVGAVDAADAPAAFSSFGPSADGRIKPDVSARGVSNPLVGTTGSPQAYTALSGTSFSQPLVAGVAACLMQARPAWTPRDVARALRYTASHATSPDNKTGFGIVRAAAALAFDPTASVPTGTPAAVSIALAGPNPVRDEGSTARVRIALAPGTPLGAAAVVSVLDPLGRHVRRLWEGVLTSETPVTLSWDGRDDGGRETGRGLYFITLEAGGLRSTVRLVRLR